MWDEILVLSGSKKKLENNSKKVFFWWLPKNKLKLPGRVGQ
jgi:hypothetical protein